MTYQCAFCGRDPYERVDVGVGTVPVAVTCCELGISVYDHRHKDDDDAPSVTVGELRAIAGRFATLMAENATLSAHQCTHGQGSDHGDWLCPVTVIEQAAKGNYWQMAKGKVRSGEPLFGAAIIEPGTNKIIAVGEADNLVTAIHNLKPAKEN